MTMGTMPRRESDRKVIATTNRGEEIYILKPPRSGQFVRRAWNNTGKRIRTSMENFE